MGDNKIKKKVKRETIDYARKRKGKRDKIAISI